MQSIRGDCRPANAVCGTDVNDFQDTALNAV
jgi:hypothetical protein